VAAGAMPDRIAARTAYFGQSSSTRPRPASAQRDSGRRLSTRCLPAGLAADMTVFEIDPSHGSRFKVHTLWRVCAPPRRPTCAISINLGDWSTRLADARLTATGHRLDRRGLFAIFRPSPVPPPAGRIHRRFSADIQSGCHDTVPDRSHLDLGMPRKTMRKAPPC